MLNCLVKTFYIYLFVSYLFIYFLPAKRPSSLFYHWCYATRPWGKILRDVYTEFVFSAGVCFILQKKEGGTNDEEMKVEKNWSKRIGKVWRERKEVKNKICIAANLSGNAEFRCPLCKMVSVNWHSVLTHVSLWEEVKDKTKALKTSLSTLGRVRRTIFCK